MQTDERPPPTDTAGFLPREFLDRLVEECAKIAPPLKAAWDEFYTRQKNLMGFNGLSGIRQRLQTDWQEVREGGAFLRNVGKVFADGMRDSKKAALGDLWAETRQLERERLLSAEGDVVQQFKEAAQIAAREWWTREWWLNRTNPQTEPYQGIK